jgi:hypothetical protein
VQKKLIDSGPCTNLSDAIYLALRCFLDEYFDDSNEPLIPDGMSKFAFYLEKLRKGIKEAGGLFPGKSSEEVIEILRQTRKEIYEERYAAHFGRK